jgi:hypothetical protein
MHSNDLLEGVCNVRSQARAQCAAHTKFATDIHAELCCCPILQAVAWLAFAHASSSSSDQLTARRAALAALQAHPLDQVGSSAAAAQARKCCQHEVYWSCQPPRHCRFM